MPLPTKLLFVTLALITGSLLNITVEPALAHSGRTNGSGCHNNRRTGDYHCHNGGNSDGSSGSSSSDDRLPFSSNSSGDSIPTTSSDSSAPRGIYRPGNIIELPGLSGDPYESGAQQTTDASPTAAGQDNWQVVSIGDGDTLRVQKGEDITTIRLACVDAPELAQTPYGGHSKGYLQSLLSIGSAVTLHQVDTDRYDRVVAEVFSEGRNINLTLVEVGQAVVYRQYLSNCDRQAYLEAEALARQNRSAFWSQLYPTMPWDFRRQQRR